MPVLKRMGRQILYVPRPEELEGYCTACRLCEQVCTLEHEKVSNPSRSRIKVVSLASGVDIPVTCNQCAMCADACPLDAITLDKKLQVMVVDREKCNGCGLCVEACPIGILFLDTTNKKAVKCDLCDGNPVCVEFCPTKVLKYTDSSSLLAVQGKLYRYAAILAVEESLGRIPRVKRGE